jgi:hypothetical protein
MWLFSATINFLKNCATFVALFPCQHPLSLFLSLVSTPQHKVETALCTAQWFLYPHSMTASQPPTPQVDLAPSFTMNEYPAFYGRKKVWIQHSFLVELCCVYAGDRHWIKCQTKLQDIWNILSDTFKKMCYLIFLLEGTWYPLTSNSVRTIFPFILTNMMSKK